MSAAGLLRALALLTACTASSVAVIVLLNAAEGRLHQIGSPHPPDGVSLYVLGTAACLSMGGHALTEGTKSLTEGLHLAWHWLIVAAEILALALVGAFGPSRAVVVACAVLVRFPGSVPPWYIRQKGEAKIARRIAMAVVVTLFLSFFEFALPLLFVTSLAASNVKTQNESVHWLAVFAILVASFAVRQAFGVVLAGAVTATAKRRASSPNMALSPAKVVSEVAEYDNIETTPIQRQQKLRRRSAWSSSLTIVSDESPKTQFLLRISTLFPISIMFNITPLVSILLLPPTQEPLVATFSLLFLLQKPLFRLAALLVATARDPSVPFRARLRSHRDARKNLAFLLHELAAAPASVATATTTAVLIVAAGGGTGGRDCARVARVDGASGTAAAEGADAARIAARAVVLAACAVAVEGWAVWAEVRARRREARRVAATSAAGVVVDIGGAGDGGSGDPEALPLPPPPPVVAQFDDELAFLPLIWAVGAGFLAAVPGLAVFVFERGAFGGGCERV